MEFGMKELHLTILFSNRYKSVLEQALIAYRDWSDSGDSKDKSVACLAFECFSEARGIRDTACYLDIPLLNEYLREISEDLHKEYGVENNEIKIFRGLINFLS